MSILGCGWLGLPLARALIAQGYLVKGSTTQLEKIPVLKKAGIFPFCLTVDSNVNAVDGKSVGEFFDSDIVVITLPFRRDFVDPRQYQKQIGAIARECEKNKKVSFVLFTSSTSLYPDNAKDVSEKSKFKPDNLRSTVLLDIEKKLLANRHFKSTIIRLAGLYGPTRKIGTFGLSQKKIFSANSPVNLIHQDDAVGLIQEIIKQNKWGEIFNGVCDFHPTKKELYTRASVLMGLPVPEFSLEHSADFKIVSNKKVKNILGYRFLHPDPLKEI